MQKKQVKSSSEYLLRIQESHSHLSNQQLIQLIKSNHKQHKIDYCMGLVEILLKRKAPLTKQFQQEVGFIQQIYTKTERCMRYFDEKIEDWSVNKLKDKNILSTKIINKSQALIRYDAEIEIDIYNLCSMIYQTGLFKNWVPFCKQSRDVKTVGVAAKVAYIKFDLPFISDREGFFYGQGVDRVSNTGSIVVYVESVTGNKALQKKWGLNLQRNQKCVDLDLKFLVCEVRQLNEKTYHFRAFAHLDTKLSFLPGFVLSFFSKKIGSFLLDKLLKQANNIKGTEWQKRITQSNQTFYPWLKKKVVLWSQYIGKTMPLQQPPRPKTTETVAKKEEKEVQKEPSPPTKVQKQQQKKAQQEVPKEETKKQQQSIVHKAELIVVAAPEKVEQKGHKQSQPQLISSNPQHQKQVTATSQEKKEGQQQNQLTDNKPQDVQVVMIPPLPQKPPVEDYDEDQQKVDK